MVSPIIRSARSGRENRELRLRLVFTEESTVGGHSARAGTSERPSLRVTRSREARTMDVGLVEALCDYSRPVFLFGA